MGVARELTSIRLSADEKAEIQARADAAGLTLNAYMRKAALGELQVSDATVLQRQDALEDRVKRLEDLAFGT